MLERIKKAFGGSGGDVRSLVDRALAPLKGVSDDLHGRCVAFVVDGVGPELLMELTSSPPKLGDDLLAYPGQLKSWHYVSQDGMKVLRKLGLVAKSMGSGGDVAGVVHGLRDPLYSSDAPSLEQWARLGRLLSLIGSGPNRTTAGVPDWFTALLNDVVATAPEQNSAQGRTKRLADQRPGWTADRLAALLALEGVAADDAPTVLVLGLFQDTDERSEWRASPHDLPGLAAYLDAHGRRIPGSAMSKLSASGRARLAERAASDPELANAAAHLLGTLSVDTSKWARLAAIKALDALAPGPRAAALAPVLAKAPAARSGELVEFLAGAEGGRELLAAAANPKIAALIEQASARRDTISADPTEDAPIEVPPLVPLPEASAAPAKAELRRSLDKAIASGVGAEDKWRKDNAKRAAGVSDADLDQLVAIADGRQFGYPKLLAKYNTWWVAEQAPSLSLLHLIRIESQDKRPSVSWVMGVRADSDTDPRVLEDALARLGIQDSTAVAERAWLYTEPEAAWPWAATHLDVVRDRLGMPGAATQALRVLEFFPSVPSVLLPAIAAIAVSESKTNRPIAQRVLSKHPAARRLAEQALDDSRGEIRAAAASWLASLADPTAVPALRAALAKEKREVVRAGLLSALEASGDDISGDLSPANLTAEAVKGLKAKPPASLAWFDYALLPTVRWADGTPVDEQVVRWWVVLADKLKDPNGQGLIDRYLSLLEPASAEALGTTMLRAWITQDTRRPTDAESREYAASEGQQRYQHAQDWVARIKSNPKWASNLVYAEQQAAIPVEEHVKSAYAEHQGVYLGSATADKGLLALTTRMPGIELANAVQAYLRGNPGRRSQTEALVYALYANGQAAALQLLLSIARRHKMAGVQATALGLVEDVAAARGWTPDELADRTIPSAGFGEDRLLHLDFGSREFVGRLTPAGAIELSTEDGKVLKALPAPRQDDDAEAVAEAKKQLTASRKEAKSVLTLQASRLYEAMCASRVWSVADWTEFLAGHPLVSQLVTRLVWLENPDGLGQRAFRPTEDGALIDAADEPVELGAGSTVGLAHATKLSAAEVEAWRSHLADYAVKPLFDQLSATVPAFAEGAVELADLAGHLSDTFSFRGVAGKRGYGRGVTEDAGWFSEYLKSFASSGLTAVLEFTGSYLPEENIPCATQKLFFRRGRRPVALAEVPPVMLAECYADYAALAALGPFDPNYEKKAGI